MDLPISLEVRRTGGDWETRPPDREAGRAWLPAWERVLCCRYRGGDFDPEEVFVLMNSGRPSDEDEARPAAGDDSFHVVGVGASAGGLEALEGLFRGMPRATGVAFVVVQHLSPDFESRMDELLRRRTMIPIEIVQHGVAVRPDTIYLAPPRHDVSLSNGKLLLSQHDGQRAFSFPIDRFFRSLAQDAGTRAIGIVLSGTGSDGSRGIRDIHEAGGVVIAQSEDSAKFDGMPRSAVDTGVVDLVLAAEDIADALTKYVSTSHTIEELDRESAVPVGEGPLAHIFELLRRESGIEFAHYKPATVARRIERRLPMVDAGNLDEYLAYLIARPEEVANLYRDLLIGVTRFFRDGEAFAYLEREVIPGLIDEAGKDGIRIWDAGCATGEEAYSLAIAFREALERSGRKPDVKIFATDVHNASLEHASHGCYREEALEGMSLERLSRWFRRERNEYHVVPELRQSIVFARHNVIHDAPFTRMDLVVCRNMLIYLQPAAQKKALSLFHFGLNSRGILFLGASETPGGLSDEFDTLERKWRIYRKLRDTRLPADLHLPLVAPRTRPSSHRRMEGMTRHLHERQIVSIYDRLLDRFMPPGFLVDEHFDLVHSFAGAERFLRVRSGRPSTSLLDLVDNALKAPLVGALRHAEREGGPVRYSGITLPKIGDSELAEQLQVVIEPVSPVQDGLKHYVISLENDTRPVPVHGMGASEANVDEVARDYIDSLETELRFTKENLQTTIEELQTSNEELQATNEELTASNEELQSTNEELHSVNEELYTVNVEHQRKIEELTELTSDLDHLLQSTDIGVVFLDRDLRIRKFTSRTTHLFRLLPQDIGRPFEAFVHAVEDENLMGDICLVLETEQVLERDVRTRQGDFYFMRVLPYRVSARTEGVLLTFVDISSLRAKEADIRRLSAAVESSRDAIIGTDLEGKIITWNQGAEDFYGYRVEEALGQSLYDLIVPPEKVNELAVIHARATRGQKVEYLETVRRKKSGALVDVSIGVSPIYDDTQRIIGASAIERDISERLAVERQMREAVAQRERFLAMLSHELRNPLAALLNASAIMMESRSSEIVEKARAIIVRQARHMARLLDDLLDVSRIRQDRIEMRKEVLDLRKTVDDVLESVKSSAFDAGIEIDVDVAERPLVVDADSTRMRQVQVNLLTNAIKYSPPGTTVTWALGADESDAIIRVSDSGRGIPEAMKDRIFEAFVRGDEHHGHEDQGMGLGLALVKSIVEAHGGGVQVQNGRDGRGAEFTVRLPLAKKRAPKSSNDAEVRRSGPMRILLVEDQDDSRLLLEALLEARGFHVRSAHDGPTALSLIDGEVPDVALVDLGLPGMSGLEVAGRLRRHPDGERIYLLALTGYGQQRDREQVFAAGFDRHLVKPLEPDVLFRVLADVPDRLRPTSS